MNGKTKEIGKRILAFIAGIIITAGICSCLGCTGTLTYTLKAYEEPTETKAETRSNLERYNEYRKSQ